MQREGKTAEGKKTNGKRGDRGGDPAAGATDLDGLGMVRMETGAVPRSSSERTYKGEGVLVLCVCVLGRLGDRSQR